MKHVVYQLTDAKAHARPTPQDHQPPDPVPRILLQWATGSGKCKRYTDDDSSLAYAEDEDKNDETSGSD